MTKTQSRTPKWDKQISICGPLQTEAIAQLLRAKIEKEPPFDNIDDLFDYDFKHILIPDRLRDGEVWSFITKPLSGMCHEYYGEFYDYKFKPRYCAICGEQWRTPITTLVRFLSHDRWDHIWICPFGHVHNRVCSDRTVRELLYSNRLIEKRSPSENGAPR